MTNYQPLVNRTESIASSATESEKAQFSPETRSWLAIWGHGIHDLVYCFQRITDAAGDASQGYNTGVGVNTAAAVGKFAWYGRDKFPLLKQGAHNWHNDDSYFKTPTPTFVVDVTMVLIAIVGMVNGFVPPNSGSDFSAGANILETVYTDLELAIPDPRDWSGAAAEAYINQNSALQQRARDMETLDYRMENAIAAQAAQVQKARLTISSILFGLIAAQGIALALYAASPSAAVIWQVVTSMAAIGLVLWIESETAIASQSHADTMADIGAGYDAVAAGKPLPSSLHQMQLPNAEQTMVSSFMDLFGTMSSTTAAAAMPNIAMLASLIPRDAFAANALQMGALTPTGRASAQQPAAKRASKTDRADPRDDAIASLEATLTAVAPIGVSAAATEHTRMPRLLQPAM
ncbi:MAG: hypothetical protein K2Q25_07440 [Mycobacteriaceae bacterium]|nr:hypothetical protein [Mycobacteriaceae bacterium]